MENLASSFSPALFAPLPSLRVLRKMRQEDGGEGRKEEEEQRVSKKYEIVQSQSQICFGEQIDRSRHFLALEPTIALFREAATWETKLLSMNFINALLA